MCSPFSTSQEVEVVITRWKDNLPYDNKVAGGLNNSRKSSNVRTSLSTISARKGSLFYSCLYCLLTHNPVSVV